ncbi:MAG: imidazoleglycerol-phosphate dehydratase [Deltaproteobacteria bacterium RBG_13_49_15]|nr:MAG: imidazoleglycerol-phosphate dehydratase [Deltaproteobacteria bacterium RBG_13_49_15]
MKRIAEVERETKETRIRIRLDLDGTGSSDLSTSIPFFDHMLSLFSLHGFFDMKIDSQGDTDVDFHHVVEDVGLVLGDAVWKALGEKKGIQRFGHAVTPMDDALTSVTVDLSNRPYLVFNVTPHSYWHAPFDVLLTKEFFRAMSTRGGMNLHVNVHYGENEHHVIESIFKGTGRALGMAVSLDQRIKGVRSTKGSL